MSASGLMVVTSNMKGGKLSKRQTTNIVYASIGKATLKEWGIYTHTDKQYFLTEVGRCIEAGVPGVKEFCTENRPYLKGVGNGNPLSQENFKVSS